MILSVTIPPAFEYAGIVIEWFYLVVLAGASFGLGYIAGGCAQRG
jgi:hypothetical protein